MEEKFTIKEFKNYILSLDDGESKVSVLQHMTAENIKKANEPIMSDASAIRDVRFPDTEEMHCPICEMPTPHCLKPANGVTFIPRDKKTWKWTCLIKECSHQL